MNPRKHTVGKIAAIGAFGLLALSAVPVGACQGVTNLKAVASCSGVRLTWTASATPGVTYTIARGVASGAPTLKTIASGLTTTSYLDTTAALGTRYEYEVIAVKGGTSSGANSPKVCVTTPQPGSCGTPTPVGALGAIPIALILGGFLVYQQRRRRIRGSTAEISP